MKAYKRFIWTDLRTSRYHLVGTDVETRVKDTDDHCKLSMLLNTNSNEYFRDM